MINFKKMERLFLSRKTAIFLLIVTIVPLAVATPAGRTSEVVSSPFFLILPTFIFLSVLLCTMDRFKKRRSKSPDDEAFWVRKTVIKAVDMADAERYLVKKGWTPEERGKDGDEKTVFIKGDKGFLGSMIFHAGILLLLVSVALTAATLFSAELLVTEGLPTSLGKEGFLAVRRKPIIPVRYPAGMMMMEKFEAVFEDGRFPVDYVAHMKIMDHRGERLAAVRVNDPLILGGLQYTIDRYGFAPGFRIEDIPTGKVLFDGYVSLFPTPEGEDFFAVPETGMSLHVRFFPDFKMTEKGPFSSSKIPNNPMFGMRLLDSKGREIEKGKLIRYGRTLYMGGLAIKAYDLKYWAHFGVIRDHGQPFIALSIVAMIAGLAIRFVYHEKWIMVVRKDDRVEVAGYSRYFPALFEGEVERIADEIGRC